MKITELQINEMIIEETKKPDEKRFQDRLNVYRENLVSTNKKED